MRTYALALVATLSLAACGTDRSSTSAAPPRATPTTRPPKAEPEFAAKAPPRAVAEEPEGEAPAIDPNVATPHVADDAVGRRALGIARPRAAPTPLATVACGDDGQPRCPLQAWMEDNFNVAVEAGDTAAVARAFVQVATMAPAPAWNQGTPSWRAFAEAGIASAQAGDLRGARAQCRACHQAFKERYRTEFRTRPIGR